MDIPRIRSRLAQITDPPELKDQWAFEISIWTLDGETMIGEPMGPFGPFKTEKEAYDESLQAVKRVSEKWELDFSGSVSGKYYDMKSGELRPWVTH